MSLFESTDKYIQEWLCRLGSLLRSLCLHQPELTNEAEIQSNSSAASKKDINKKKKDLIWSPANSITVGNVANTQVLQH